MASAFLSYIRDNSKLIDRLVNDLRRGGVNVWLDRDALTPGEPWARAIQNAILGGSYFLACFSREYHNRQQTYMNEELTVAYQTATRKGFDAPWLIPVLLNPCEIPDQRITNEHTLRSLQCVDLAGDWHEGLRQLLNLLEPSRSFGQLRRSSRDSRKPPRDDVSAPLLALDFGTSFSSMSIFTDDRGWQAIPDGAGRTLIPSVVTFAENWDYFVGWDAVAAAVHTPGRSIANIKRGLGGDADFHVEHKRFDPETLASLVIRFLKDNAEQHLDTVVSKALVAAPANFSNAQSTALARACERAGLQVQRLIGEPNAAGLVALQWWQEQRKAGAAVKELALVLVVDMGGGTTDVSLIEVADDDDIVEILLVAGDNELGGMDYDNALYQFVKAREVGPMVAAGMPWTALDDHRLLQETSRAKVQLGFAPAVTLVVGETEQSAGLQLRQSSLTRADLQAAVQPLDARLETLIDQVLHLAKKGKYLKSTSDLSAVFLAGQGAKIYTVAQLLKRLFPETTLVTDYQEQAVVRGLGVYAGVLGGVNKNVLMIEVLHRGILLRCLALDASDDAMISSDATENLQVLDLLKAHDTIPCRKTYALRVINGNGHVTLDFLEGDIMNRQAPLLSVPVDPPHGTDQLYVVIDADENKTAVVSVFSEAKTLLAERQLTNNFLEQKPETRKYRSAEAFAAVQRFSKRKGQPE